MTPEDLKSKIEQLGPDTHAIVEDLTGTQNHYRAEIISPLFEGKSTLQRQRLVNTLLSSNFASGDLHALTLKTFSTSEKNHVS